ncbi:ABC transporter substrate-binding protein [Paenibacillus polymyxa]|uniref:ABC transporter substrate-binding protein n=1 Tax=Paenibacillus polymyxa TaxID=1406 RepID=UPI002ED089A4|nr:ABC transporter substrate-binding protein [Paenibacillus polymyxa]
MKKFSMLLILLSVFMMLVACNSTKENTAFNCESPVDHSKNSCKEETSAMRTIQTVKGRVDIPINPKRIVDLAYTSEQLLIMGYTPVMSSTGLNGKTPSYLNGKLDNTVFVSPQTVKIEDIVAAKPDLIISNSRTEKMYDQLSKIAPTIYLENDLYSWRKQFPELGRFLGKEKEVDAWFEQYSEKAKKIGDEIKAKFPGETFTLYVTNATEYRIYGRSLLGDVLFTDMELPAAKGVPLGKPDSTVEIVSLDTIYSLQPDQIFVGYYAFEPNAEELVQSRFKDFVSNPLFNRLKAAKEGKVYSMVGEEWHQSEYQLGKEQVLETIRQKVLGTK